MSDAELLFEKSLQDLLGVAFEGNHLSIIMQAIRSLTIAAENASGAREPKQQPVFKFQRQTRRAEYLVLGHMDGDMARRLYNERRVRDKLFAEDDLFGEPAWDLLLDALAAELERKPISVTSACIASAVPPTTALRWISLLIGKGYLSRTQDELDQRRAFLRITNHGKTQMQRYFDRIAKLR